MSTSIPLVYQETAYTCSLACARMVKPDVPPPRPNIHGLSCDKFREWAVNHGILVAEGHGHTPQPGDILLFPDHFVVYGGETKRYVKILDPDLGRVRMSRRKFRQTWEGWLLRCA